MLLSQSIAYHRSAVNTLAVCDGTLKEVCKFLLSAEKIRSNKVHHAPILCQVVLKGIPCHYDTSPAKKRVESVGVAIITF